MYNPNTMRDKIKSGKPLIGPFSRCGDPALIEIAGYTGFDYVIIDMEHGPNNAYTLQNLCRGADVANIASIVRVSSFDEIGKALDQGATGVQVPMIESVEAAEEALKAAKFAPEGLRGVCRFQRAAQYSSMDKFQYFKQANETIVILQIEGAGGVANLDGILALKGIDIIFIGPYDLSQSLGLTGQVDHPDVVAKMKEIVDKCKSKGVAVGTFVDNAAAAKKWIAEGVQYISYSTDMGIYTDTCKAIMENFK